MKSTRDIGLTGDSHGAGKGDKCRTTDTNSFRRLFDEIIFPLASITWRRHGTKLVKKYK